MSETIMGLLLQVWILVCCSVGFYSAVEESDNFDSATLCRHIFGNHCFEFAEDSQTWMDAQRVCQSRGGDLLQSMDALVTRFLKNISTEVDAPNQGWWLGEAVAEEQHHHYAAPDLESGSGDVSGLCTYLTLNPLQVVSTTNCTQTLGVLCTHDLQFPPDASDEDKLGAKTRFARSSGSSLDGINVTLNEMEIEVGEPTDANRDKVIASLLSATQSLTPADVDEINLVINYTSAILTLSLNKCDVKSNPNPESLFESIFEISKRVSLLLSLNSNQQFVIKHPSGTIYQQSFTPAGLGDTELGTEEDGYIKLPSFSALQPFVGGYENVIAQMASFKLNPHPSDNISGVVCNLALSNGTDDIRLSNLENEIEIFLPRSNASALMNSLVQLEENMAAVTQINISDPDVTVIFTVEPSTNKTLRLLLSHGEPPNSTSYRAETFLSLTDGYRWTITPDMLGGRTGLWYIDTRLNSSWESGLTLQINSFMAKCLYWDVEQEMWSSSGCRVGEKSIPELTQCLCNHLTLFGSSFFVMPNYVDLSRTAELFATVRQNFVVLALLCAFFGLYLITLVWACFADRRARSKMKMTLLEDNHPGAQYNYLISVQTSNRSNAGTSSNVTLRLIGSEGESETHHLTDPDKPVLERGGTDLFLLAAPFPLGDLKHVRLQHDNTGGHPSWYVNKVTIQDLQTRQVWHFFCGCWLSADRGDGITKRSFNVAKSNEIASFRNIFQTRTSTGFRDEHIWVSIVDPPSRSPFTRAQRVSCCMSLLLCTMAINIAFWNVVDEDSPVLLSIGSLHITWQEIMVGVQSGLLMFPINILIITIFRSIKPRVLHKKDKNDKMPTGSQPVTVASILKETEELISLLSQSPRNNMSERPRLESSLDLMPSLHGLHELIQQMQGEADSHPHLVYCSQFLFSCLSHLLLCLEKVNGNHFTNAEEHQYAISMTNLLVRKAEMVFSSHATHCPRPPARRAKKAGGCWLPWWCVFIGWFLLLSISGVSTFFTLLYGFQYGKQKSIQWVISLGMSLFQSIFVLQPLKVIGVAVFFALLLKPVAVEESEEVEQVLSAQRHKRRQYTGRDTV